MKPVLIACLTLMTSGLCYAEVDSSSAFLGESMESQKAQDFYRSRCESLASDSGIRSTDAQHQEYMAGCLEDMKVIWPLGYDESEN